MPATLPTPGLPAAPTTPATSAVTQTPPTVSGSGGSPNTGPWLLAAAVIALVGVVVSQVVQGNLARRSNRLTQASLDATREIAERAAERARAEANRAEAASLAQRYQEAAAQLGHASAAVRLAGVYAMAKLADDWSEQRQQCVDVLCAYLRMPWDPFDPDDGGEGVVRATVSNLISGHVAVRKHPSEKNWPQESWSSLRFDFDGAKLHNFNLRYSVFEHPVYCRNATFSGESILLEPRLEGGLLLQGSSIDGGLRIIGATLGANFFAPRTVVSDGSILSIEVVETTRRIYINVDEAQIGGSVTVTIGEESGDIRVSLSRVVVESSGRLALEDVSGRPTAGWLATDAVIVHPHAAVVVPFATDIGSWSIASSGSVKHGTRHSRPQSDT